MNSIHIADIGPDVGANRPSTFAQYTRPEQARLLRALNLDVSYLSAHGDILELEESHSRSINSTDSAVLDLVGGYGAALFGHNNPHLVQVAKDCLGRQVPFSAQASIRTAAGNLSARLSALVGATTGSDYVITLGSTGADAVEAAVRHASVSWGRRLSELQDNLDRQLRRARRDNIDGVEVTTGNGVCSIAELLTESVNAIATLRRNEPEFVSLAGAFHGKTAAAGALTDHTGTASELAAPGPRTHRLEEWDPEFVVRAFDDSRVPFCSIAFNGDGDPHVTLNHVSKIAACFAEPIQGEGGVHVVPSSTLRALRNLADRHGAVLVFDEIQSGMGRTGTFLASEASGVSADYYLLSKSLGGGLAKISAMLVESTQYVADFGRHHTSTFADDHFSSTVAEASLDLLQSVQPRIARAGKALRAGLDLLVASWPDIFVEVRGRGLLLGLELRPPRPSRVLAELTGSELYGYAIAGYLLHTHGIRVLPTLSAPTTLRIQPSAYIDSAEIKRAIDALEQTATLIRRGDYATLFDHLAEPTSSTWMPPQAVARPRKLSSVTKRRSQSPPRVAFLANLKDAGDLRTLAPELRSWSSAQCSALLDRLCGVIEPFELTTEVIASPEGVSVEVCVIVVPITPLQAVECQRAGHGSWLRSLVLDAVDRAVGTGSSVVGLGGYTSIVTNAARDVAEDSVRVTSGNSLTAACAFEQLREALAALPDGQRTVGVVGAIGNIGAVMAELLAPHSDLITLVGRPGAQSRLRRLADGLFGTVRVAEDLIVLRDCRIIVTATNSPAPIIDVSHIASHQPVVVCDLAVPGDVSGHLAGLPNVTVIAGGRVQLPDGQEPSFPGTDLPPGVIYACMAETILLGFEPTTASPSFGALTVNGVRAAQQLAARHKLSPCGQNIWQA